MVELFVRGSGPTGAFSGKASDEVIDLDRLIRQRTTRRFPCCVGNIPAVRDQAVKAASKTKLGFDRVVGEIVEWKKAAC